MLFKVFFLFFPPTASEIILKSAHWPRRRCCLKGFSIFSSDGHFVQRSRTILAILVEGHLRNITVKFF